MMETFLRFTGIEMKTRMDSIQIMIGNMIYKTNKYAITLEVIV